MKWKLSLLIALVVGGLLGSWIKNLPGFVIIAYDKTSYEMRLWIVVCLLLLIFTAIYVAIAVLRGLFASAGRVKDWQGGRHWRRSRQQTIDGMLAFTEGRWKVSEQAMIAAAKTSDTKLINYLIAAQAAQHQNAEVRRDAYLRQAYQVEPAAATAIGLTQAQLQLQHHQYEQALASLKELKRKNPNHPFVLKLLCQIYQQVNDWTQLLDLLPRLKKQHVFNDDELNDIEHRAVAGKLHHQANLGDVESLKDTWLNLPSLYRKSRKNQITYVELLIEFAQMDDALNILKTLMKKEADAEVLRLFGLVQASDAAAQLNFLENWLKSQSQPAAEAYLTLGKVAFNAKLWGKARHYLEQSLHTQPGAEAYLYMAKTLIELEDELHAADCFRLGLEFAAHPAAERKALSLPQGSNDLITADLLPQFQKLEIKS